MQHPPFATWSDTDHSGAVIITTTLCMLYWIIAGAVQQILSIGQGIIFSWAESLFGVSMLFAAVQSILVLVACHYGLGKSNEVLLPRDLYKSEQIYYASNIFYAVTLGLIKCSAGCFIANLTVKGMGSLRHVPASQKIPLYVVLGLSIAWTVASIVTLAAPCSETDPSVNTKEMCVGTVARWVGIYVGDAITDLAIAGYAASVIWRTNAPVTKRLVWYLPFCIRICVVFWAGLRLLTINQNDLTNDPTISLWLFVIMTQAQILFSLLGAASPALKKTMVDLATNYGATSPEASKAGGSYQLKYLRSKRSGNQLSENVNESKNRSTIPFSGPAKGSSVVRVSSRNRRGGEERVTSDGDSQEGIIRQDDFEVHYDNSTNTSERYDRYGASEEAYQPQR